MLFQSLFLVSEQDHRNRREFIQLLSLFLTGYTYTCIGCIIKQSKHPGNSEAARDNNYNKSKNKVVKTLTLLVCAFTLCWFPLHLFNILADFTNTFQWFSEHTINSFYYISQWLAMANCTLNPVIYGYSTKKFRVSFFFLNIIININLNVK